MTRGLLLLDVDGPLNPYAAEFARLRAGTSTLLVHVDPRQGLGSAHFAAVREWA